MFDEKGEFYDYSRLQENASRIKWFEYLSIRHAIPSMWKYWINPLTALCIYIYMHELNLLCTRKVTTVFYICVTE